MELSWLKKIAGALLVIALVVAVSTPVLAQRYEGTLRGTVVDPQGAAIKDATVTITNESTGIVATTKTTDAGIYVFPSLLVGSYTVKVQAPGMKTYVNKGVAIAANAVQEVAVKMVVGGESTTIEVVAGAEMVQTESSQLNNNFNYSRLQQLPGGSNPLNLAILLPNTTAAVGGTAGSGGSVGGTRPRMNNFTIDGVDDNDVSVTGPVSTTIADALEEFDVSTNQFSAEFGHSAGGQFSLVTKSGGNSWHGNVFWFTQNRHLNAEDNIQKAGGITRDTLPRYDNNIAGFSVGGPILKDKLFIFGAAQKHWVGQEGSAYLYEAPTAAGLATLNALAIDPAITAILAQFPTVATATGTINVCQRDNLGVVTATGCALVAYGSGTAFIPSFSNEWDFQINGDLNLTSHQIHARYLFNRFRSPNTTDGIPQSQFNGTTTYDVRKSTLKDVWNINNHLVNEATLAYTLQNGGFWTVPAAFANFPNVYIDSFSNFMIGPQSVSPQGGKMNVYQISDHLTLVSGKHTWKFGVEGRKWIGGSNFLPRGRGDWEYGGGTYTGLDEFVSDWVPQSFAKRGAGSGAFIGNQSAVFFFVQDDFKVTQRLTLNLGLRYELVTNPKSDSWQTLNEIATLPGTVFNFKKPKNDTNNWAPRIGFAWDPTGSGKWSIRGGFGVAYDVTFQNLPLLELPPQLQSEQDAAITCGLPGAPAWCPNYLALGGHGSGFLNGGGLLSVNVPPANQADARGATQGIILDTVDPEVFTWSIGFQRQLTEKSSVEVRYMGTASRKLPVQVQQNARTAFNNGATPLPMFFSAASALASGLNGTSPTLTDFNSFKMRPYVADGFLGSVTAFPAVGSGNYHSVSIDYHLRPWHGFSLNANYTLSKNIDDATNELYTSQVNPRRPQDSENVAADKGLSTLDVRHKFAMAPTWEIPGLSKDHNAIARGFANGWVLGTTYLLQSGQPLTVLSFRDLNGNFDSAGDRAILNPSGVGLTASDSGYLCWNGAALVTNGTTSCESMLWNTVGYYALDPTATYIAGRPGNLATTGRDNFPSPGLNNWNIQITKNTHITESKYIQFRFEMFNAFNHRQFSYANASITSNTYYASYVVNPINARGGDFNDFKTLNGGSRNIQLGLKFFF